MMKAGVGYCNNKDAFASGRTIAESAMKSGGIEMPGLVVAFCGGLVDGNNFFKGLQSVVGQKVPIIGGSAVGIITNNDLSYEGFPAGAAILESDQLVYKIACADNLDKDEMSAGKRLAENYINEEGKLLLIFYDSIKLSPTAATPPVMNASPPLIAGIEKTLREPVPIIGAGLVGSHEFGPTVQFCGSYVTSQSVVGALLRGGFRYYYQIMHGCTPKDGIYHTITKVEGSVIYEIDGKPVVKMIDDMYGSRDWQKQMPVKRLTIGINHGEKYGEYNEENYVNRLIAGVLPDGAGIVIFEPDLSPGTEIQFMLRDSKKMIESAMHNPVELMVRINTERKRPVVGFYIDCAGRSANISETLIEEAAEISKVFNKANVPLLGFYSGVEIAPLLGKSRGLDWTGVLLVLTEEI